jgi:hypothetical protein
MHAMAQYSNPRKPSSDFWNRNSIATSSRRAFTSQLVALTKVLLMIDLLTIVFVGAGRKTSLSPPGLN